ncbi:MAG: D-hexose-6-phosphate mutarotase, partial [Verrucomicrobia bacterium]|nr:D-hexose-6-phosphate mutarotase [Verrucomicrobiota bacterium]
MSNPKSKSCQRKDTFPRVTFLDGRGDLPMLEITTPWSSAEIYLHGAHVTHFKKHDEPPLLFLSHCSRFASGQPIRGGIPIIFPWFGKPADKPGQHGFARIQDWELREMSVSPDGAVSVRLQMPAFAGPKPTPDSLEERRNSCGLGSAPESAMARRRPECIDSPEYPACAVEYFVTASDALTVELVVMNKSAREFTFENCLHTYFAVGDISAVKVIGLKGTNYLNQPTNFSRHTDANETIRFGGEVDRAYLNTIATVEIQDASLRRVIRVEKEGSASTVVWNPW